MAVFGEYGGIGARVGGAGGSRARGFGREIALLSAGARVYNGWILHFKDAPSSACLAPRMRRACGDGGAGLQERDGVVLVISTDTQVGARAAIRARNLTKKYGDFTAVNGISFDIREGECFGFLGPNGAGKTSTMKMLACVSPASGGELVVDGMDVRRDQRAIKLSLGIVSQADSLDPDLSVFQNLYAYGRYFNMPRAQIRERAHETLALFQLEDKAHNAVDELSGGMRRRLLIARAMLHQPRVLVLDEPTTGLDPQARLLVWEKLVMLKGQGITILLTTHYMDEAEHLCDRLVVIDNGNILVEGVPGALISEHVGDNVVELRINPTHMAGMIKRLSSRGLEFEYGGDSLYFYGDNGAGLQDDSSLNGYRIINRPGNLEDLFLRLTGRGLREG